MFNASLSLDLEDRLQLQKSLQERQKELILIEPHPDAKGIDHDFQSPTLESKLRDHIAEYKNQNGEYE